MTDTDRNAWLHETLNTLYAENLALRILTMRMWGYFAQQSASSTEYLDRQKQMALESLEMYEISGHRDPNKIKQLAAQTITQAFDRLVLGRKRTDPLQ
jgi:hypothetical protein